MGDIDTVLRAGSREFAESLRPAAADLVRARGERRRRRQILSRAVLFAVAAATALGGYRVLAGPSAWSHPAGTGGLSLAAPSRYVQGAFNPVTFTIPAMARRTDLRVEVRLGHPSYEMDWMPGVARRNSATGRLIRVELSGPRRGPWTGSYRVAGSARPLRQTLLLIPAGATGGARGRGIGRLSVRVFAGKRLIAEQGTAAGKLSYLTGSWAPRRLMAVPAGSSRDITLTIGYPAGPGYPADIRVIGALCVRATNCKEPRGDEIEWMDAGTWRQVQPTGMTPLATASLTPGKTVTIRFRVIAGASTAAASGSLYVVMYPRHWPGFYYGALPENRARLHLDMG